MTRQYKADFTLDGAWETWIFEAPDDWTPEDGYVSGIELIGLDDAGSDSLDLVIESVQELD